MEDALERLERDADALVLVPGSRYVWMVEPFSGLPTSFVVRSGARRWWGNCIWHALAIPPLVGADATVSTACPDCGEPLELSVTAAGVTGSRSVTVTRNSSGNWEGAGTTNRLEPGWRRRTPEQRRAILDTLGMTAPFWRL